MRFNTIPSQVHQRKQQLDKLIITLFSFVPKGKRADCQLMASTITQILLINYLIDCQLLFENTKIDAIVNEHKKRWDDVAWVLESKPELMGALHSHPYECPVSVLTAIWNFTQQCRRSQNDLWLNTARVGWRYSRTSRATGIKEPPARRRYTEVYSYPATTSHLWLRSKQVRDGPPRLRGTKASARGSRAAREADEEW
jgi:hypothetical protein